MSDDDVYFNAYLQNTYDSQSNTDPGFISGLYTFTSPLLKKCDDYQIAVASLSVPDQYIPYFYWPLNPATGVDNLFTVYCRSNAQIGTNTYSSAIATYVDIANGGLANRPILKVDQILATVNQALTTACAASGLSSNIPTMFFANGLFQIFYPLTMGVIGAGYFQIGFSESFNSLFAYNMPTTLDFTSIPTSSIAWINTGSYTIKTYLAGSSFANLISGSGSQIFGVVSQTFASPNALSKITAIRVTLQQCPIRQEQAVTQVTSWTGNTSPSQSLGGVSILTDLLWTADFSGKQTYFPSVLSYHNFDSSEALQRFAVQVTILDAQNNTYLLPIPNGSMVTIKFRFTKRELIEAEHHKRKRNV